MRIGVVGNCMAPGIGIALRQILPDAEIFAFEAREVLRAEKLVPAAATLARCDAVFTHHLPDDYGPLAISALKDRHRGLHRLPTNTFTGFHPDCIYLSHEGKQYGSPLGAYHSAIAAAAYSLTLDASATLRLFNAEVFRQLGYLDEFGKARSFLAHEFQQCGIDLGDDIWRWMERGAFMHTVNHPKGVMVAGIAKLLAVRLGLISAHAPIPDLAYDALSVNAIWPVYPGIAEVVGVSGSYLFKRQGGPDLVGGAGVFHSLPEFVALSFEMYARWPASVFTAPAVARVASVVRRLI